MRVKNVSSRLHHVGEVSIAPGEEKDIPDSFKNAINTNELVEVLTAAEKVDEKAAAIKAAESKLSTAKASGNAKAIAAAEAALAELTVE